MKNHLTIQKSFSLLTIAALIINVAVSGISNSSMFSYLLKFFSSSLLLAIFFFHLRLSNISLNSLLTSRGMRGILLIVTTFVFYFAITLLYSSNPLYGAQKITNIIVSVLPNIVVLYFLVKIGYKNYYSNHLFIVIALGFILIITPVLLFNPFDHSTSYQFSPLRWSHVFIGRMVSFLSLVVFFYLMSAKEFNKKIIYTVAFITGIYLTYLTGLRSALIGLVLCSVISFGWYIYKKYLNAAQLYSIISVVVLTSLLILITPEKFVTPERMNNMLKIENLDFGGDQPILFRVESYKLSWQMFKQSPLIGSGFGSFNGFDNIEWTRNQKYPHNIILEILSELGIVGLLIFGLLFLVIIRSMYNVQFTMINEQTEVKSQKLKVKNDYTSSLILTPHFLLITFFFCLLMAMFSKDISTQGFLWLFIVFAGFGKK